MNPRRAGQWLLLVTVAALVALALLWFSFALTWRMQRDTPLMYYAALLMDSFGRVPYRDFFETSFPGTFVLHWFVLRLFGYTDSGFVVFNVLHVVAVALAGAALMRPFGWRVTLAGPAIFALLYFSHGPAMMLQRDYLVVLPLALGLVVARRQRWVWSHRMRAFLVGLLFGLAGAIKPQMVLGALPVLFYISFSPVPLGASSGTSSGAASEQPDQGIWSSALWMALGGFVVIAPLFVWLWWVDALASFWELYTRYVPLHLELTGDHRLLEGSAYLRYYLGEFIKLGGYVFLVPLALLGALLAWRLCEDRARRALLLLLLAEAVTYGLLPGLAGQFWDYHWMPFAWVLSMLVALLLMRDVRPARHQAQDLSIVVGLAIALGFAAYPSTELRMQMHGESVPPPLGGRVDEISAFLNSRLRPGDTVQPLDWTWGAIHAMLQARAPLATRFLYDYHFYHHPDEPLITELREHFLNDLAVARPRFVIEVHNAFHPKDQPGAPRFAALDTWLHDGYRIVKEGREYQIWERR